MPTLRFKSQCKIELEAYSFPLEKKKTVEGCAFRLNLLKDISLLFDPSPLRENTVTSKFHYKRNKALIFCVVAVAKVGL